MAKQHLVIGVGEVLWDVFDDQKFLGGAPANVAYHSSSLGAKAQVLSRVGDDALGSITLNQLRDNGIDTSLISIGSHPTGTVRVTLDATNSAQNTFPDDVAWDHLEADPVALSAASQADALCFGTLAQRSSQSRSTIRQLLQAAKPEALRVLDLNLRCDFFDKELIADSLQQANILKINNEELAIIEKLFALAGSEDEQLQTLAQTYSLKAIALTKGGEGSTLLRGNEIHHQQAPKTELVDTVGAGDSFTATLIAGLLASAPLAAINSLASAIAAFVCTQPGATPSLPQSLVAQVEKITDEA